MGSSADDAVERARQTNRRWITRGRIADNTERYMDELAARDPQLLGRVCRRALDAARRASRARRDPKPEFYASIFSSASREDRDRFLRDHFFTRLLSAEIQANHERRP